MKVEQTSELIKAPNSTIQRLVNARIGAMKINSQETARVWFLKTFEDIVEEELFEPRTNSLVFLIFTVNLIPLP
jgi:hypothetical protein